MNDPDALLDPMLADYAALAPQYRPLVEALRARGETVVNDHIALRTLDLPEVGLDAMAAPFRAAGWQWARDRYDFPAKRVRARYLRPPRDDLPRVFISELKLDEIDRATRERLCALLGTRVAAGPTVPGRPWRLDAATHAALAEVSEYAAWFAACGWRVNHATVAVHRLQGFVDLAAFVDWVEAEGFPINAKGGRIKGSAEAGLEQGSTRAPAVRIDLDDGPTELPGCYVEFAWRHPLGDDLFDGFIASSADRIFESTDRES